MRCDAVRAFQGFVRTHDPQLLWHARLPLLGRSIDLLLLYPMLAEFPRKERAKMKKKEKKRK